MSGGLAKAVEMDDVGRKLLGDLLELPARAMKPEPFRIHPFQRKVCDLYLNALPRQRIDLMLTWWRAKRHQEHLASSLCESFRQCSGKDPDAADRVGRYQYSQALRLHADASRSCRRGEAWPKRSLSQRSRM